VFLKNTVLKECFNTLFLVLTKLTNHLNVLNNSYTLVNHFLTKILRASDLLYINKNLTLILIMLG